MWITSWRATRIRSGSRLVKRYVYFRMKTKINASLNKNIFRIPVIPVYSGVQVTLDSLLHLFRQENTDPDEKIFIHVKRDDLLHDALKVVARSKFSFRKTPIISFSGEETDRILTAREFFR